MFKPNFLHSMLLISSFCFLGQPLIADPPKKLALLVAVGNYPTESGWQKINSGNDVDIVKKALLAQGFPEANIQVVMDGAATKLGILEAIRRELLEKSKPGDVAYFHFSGHGQQVADDNGDELDGYDEAIVPINSPQQFEAGVYEGQNLIRDDQLGQLFHEIQQKLGPKGNLMVVLDACHSGTGTRGFGIARGTQFKMAPKGYIPRPKAGDDAEIDARVAADLAPIVAFFGAAHNQLNFETVDEHGISYGSLSFAFSKKFALVSASTTYRTLFEQIRLEMSAIAPRQQPQAEGMLDQVVMGGAVMEAPAYFKVAQWNDPGSLRLDAGWLHGIQEGTVVGIYPMGTLPSTDKEPLARGIVTKVDATTCLLTLDTDIRMEDAEPAWAYLLEQSFGNLDLSIKLGLPSDNLVLKALQEKLEKLPIRQQDNNPALIVTLATGARANTVQLVTKDDQIIETYDENLQPEAIAARIIQQAIAFGQARFLKHIEIKSSELSVNLELVPINYDRRNNVALGPIPLTDKLDSDGIVHFRAGDVIKIKVTNQGNKPAYFTLLDIQPDNKMAVLIPGDQETPAEYLVQPGQSLEVKRLFEFGPPAGTEVFKLIATDNPIDLRPIANSRGVATKSNGSKFEQLFAYTYMAAGVQSRGSKPVSIGLSEVNIVSFCFDIDAN